MTEQDPNLPENLEPLPDPETPLADLVGEEYLGADEADEFYEGDEDLVATGSRRIPPEGHAEDLLEGVDDEPAASRDNMEQDQPEIIRQRQEGRITLLPLALGFIGMGGLLLAERN